MPMVRRSRRQLVLAGIGVLILLGGVATVTTAPPVPPPVKVPVPNGYDDLMAAARKVRGNGIVATDLVGPNPQVAKVLRPFVEMNADALKLVRRGLNRPCLMPLRYTWEFEGLRAQTPLDELTLLIRAEGDLALAEGRLKDELRAFRELVIYGDAIARGGLRREDRAGHQAQLFGWYSLWRMRERIETPVLRELVRELGARDRDSEEAATVTLRERAYGRALGGWATEARDFETVFRPNIAVADRRNEVIYEDYYLRADRANVRLYLLEMAIEAYRRRHGTSPARLADLAPEILDAIPLDPFGDKPFVYRTTGGTHRLYSVGPNRKDDGGKAGQGDDLAIGP